MATGRGTTGPSKRDRREEARETARQMREAAAKKAKRRKVAVQSAVIAGVVAVLAIVGIVIYSSVSVSNSVANPKNMLSGGVLLSAPGKAVATPAIKQGDAATPTKQELDGKTAHIQLWVDYQCPICQQFETAVGGTIKQMLTDGTATLETHPVAILDNAQNKQYSTRSAAAVACVANEQPDKFLDVNAALFANQPSEQTGTGLTNAQILKIFKDTGVESKTITDCTNSQTFATFVTNQTKTAATDSQLRSSAGSFGTPTVFVNGQRYQGSVTNAEQFKAFIAAVLPEKTSGSVTFPTAAP
ncbi:hypothetical protein O159_21090 [Leifsonia xyli subsp. cynodontis DSM 46306]|uniref:Thioredoxin-like fold domain-containing protein n=1 Tax=Leifsonia xyli subsp. cynodontis DSM 46306 TaxID=1389489 RepID=U3P8F0_LEIXC|nr:thioredoxin domain-containing protein [Leifsonia xyli]AGW42091.1 hypothetical protein O159_21090 [Leifsonia xyli subsp. cynodontis DSM 46306]